MKTITATDLCGNSIMIINTDGIPDTIQKFQNMMQPRLHYVNEKYSVTPSIISYFYHLQILLL